MSSNCTWTSRRTNGKMGTGVRRQNTIIQAEANTRTLSTHGTLHILVLRFPGISTLLKATASRYQSASNKSHPPCASTECRWCCISLSQGILLNCPLRAILWATAIGIHRAQKYCTLICSPYSIYASFPIGDMWITRELFMVLWTKPLLEIWLEEK